MLQGEVVVAVAFGVGLGEADVPKVKPLVGEGGEEALRFRVGEETFDLLVKDLWVTKGSFFGEFVELAVGLGFPEKVAQA